MFLIIGKNDVPLFEANLNTVKREIGHLNHFIAHSALDIVDEEAKATPSMYLKVVDKFNELSVSAYVTAGNVRFMLVHDSKDDDKIKNFFVEIYELFIKALMNPLFDISSGLSGNFDKKVKAIAKKYLY
mmetsp:Transcript_736/g.1175  ORF Transcript_736/g.1175 Transcript_736/m.1175 type:complete len:129 (+) Transcript_736:1367-1753(+)